MRLLDLYCGAGGCTRGYQEAGFEVWGVDNEPQPNYVGDSFDRADALRVLEHLIDGDNFEGRFDAIHASPPCQAYTSMNRTHPDKRASHPALIGPTRDLLEQTGLPYVIENVPAAAPSLVAPWRLCGRSFGLPIHRHRLFETNFPMMLLACPKGREVMGIYGKLDGRRIWTRADGSELRAPRHLKDAQHAMGIDWMEWDELKEAIPPAYTRHIGSYLLSHVKDQSPVCVERGKGS